MSNGLLETMVKAPRPCNPLKNAVERNNLLVVSIVRWAYARLVVGASTKKEDWATELRHEEGCTCGALYTPCPKFNFNCLGHCLSAFSALVLS
jgi:hypothetical protein